MSLALCPVVATLLSLLYFSNLVVFVVVGQGGMALLSCLGAQAFPGRGRPCWLLLIKSREPVGACLIRVSFHIGT